jgi:TRAP-type C4-dicarboxylate transport system permease large subunit
MLFATGSVVAWLVIRHHVPMFLGEWLQSASSNWMIFMALVMFFMLLVGAVIDPAASIIMFVPIFAPIAETYGINPYHFGVVFVLILQIGLLTPPVGLILFLCARLGDISLEEVVKGMWPFILLLLLVLAFLVFLPQTYMWFPKLLGY